MLKALTPWIGVLVLLFCPMALYAQFTDNFDTPHDYLANGVAGTSWSGFVGLDANETAQAINASMDRPGQLYLSVGADGGVWEGGTNLGPFLYTDVSGNFVASIKVTDYAGDANAPVYYNECGLMAREATVSGNPENFVSLGYFPLYSVGDRGKTMLNGALTYTATSGAGWDLMPYLQIERNRDTFILRTSADGQTWQQLGDPIDRPDLHGVPVQVGPWECTYNSDPNGYAAFDDFSLQLLPTLDAGAVYPADSNEFVPLPVTLQWDGGDTAVFHKVYFGTDPNALAYIGQTILDITSIEIPNDLSVNTTYYWRVDEIDAQGTVYPSKVFTFATGVPQSIFPLVSMKEGFETAHNFVTDGVQGTDWDGLIATDGTDAVIDANISRPGELYLESDNAAWAEDWSALGPYLYRNVKGDFVATVKVADYAGDPNNPVYHNNASLMVRNINNADAGDGEDWFSLDYFPIWNCGNMIRTADNGVRTDGVSNNGLGWDAAKYLQIERQGSLFHFRISFDGLTWQEMDNSPIERDDFAGLPVEVGVTQCTFNNTVGYAAFDDFTLVNTFNSNASTDHDFVADGVAGTDFDGLVATAGTDVVADANINEPGQLYLQSDNAAWAEDWSALGPYLYRVVDGNFVATVQVTDYAGDPNNPVYHNNASLMVRNVTDADAGDGEDWLSLDYFPIWNCGNMIRTADNGARTDGVSNNGLGWDAATYLQIERQGNLFHFRISFDGLTWQEMDNSPIERDDFAGLPVEVGVTQCTFNNTVGYAAFGGLTIVAE